MERATNPINIIFLLLLFLHYFLKYPLFQNLLYTIEKPYKDNPNSIL